MEDLLNEIKAERLYKVLTPQGCDKDAGTTVPAVCEGAQGPAVPDPSLNSDSGLNSSLAQFVGTMEQLAVKSALPPLEVVKFSGDPCQYNTFTSRFNTMVHSQNISDSQKMARLLQFVDGRAKTAISGFDGVQGGLEKSLAILKRRFGQPHMITEACAEALVNGPNIASNDTEALNDFADKSRTVLETLVSIDALGEMNMANLSKMSRKLPLPLQYKWRDQAQKKRDLGGTVKLQELVKFIERSADAANDPIFGRVGETKRDKPKPTSHVASGIVKEKKRNFSTQVQAKIKNNPAPARKRECYECKSNHLLKECPDFKATDYKHRSSVARANGLCFNCLFKDNFIADCKTAPQCTECTGKHHTLLHRDTETKPKSVDNYAIGSGTTNSKIALQTVPVRIIGPDGASIKTFALLDSASEESFFDAKLAKKLKIGSDGQEQLNVCTMTGESTVKVGKSVLQLKPATGDTPGGLAINVPVKVVEDFSIDTNRPADLSKWSHLKGITIPEVDEDQVHLLIGTNVPAVQIHLESRIGEENEPFAVRTVLGWSVFGPLGGGQRQPKVKVNFLRHNATEIIESQMAQLLELDNVGVAKKKGMSIEDRRALTKLEASTKRIDGRYEVGMLWKADDPWLPNNKTMAESRLESLRRKLSEWNFHVDTEGFTVTLHWKKADHVIKESSENSPVLFANRRRSIRKRERDKRRLADYLERKRIKDSAGKRKGDIKEQSKTDIGYHSQQYGDKNTAKSSSDPRTYSTTMDTPNVLKQVIAPPCYREMVEKRPMFFHWPEGGQEPVASSRLQHLPHHAVFHPRKPDKVRVVFDAAAKYQGVCLNDQLVNGPDLTNSLLGILVRFREKPVAIVGDIEGFFLRVGVPEDDSEALRFLWWENGDLDGQVVVCKMTRHIFGAKDSPSCCYYALKRTAKDAQERFSSEIVTSVERQYYVDDHLSSLPNTAKAIDAVRDITAITATGGFRTTG
ncbi:uncharacterized protein LOC135482959 [Lineus longissimus]|uniref:uncharacterized protein LOC135482959 n=1 Tax=Lineus longissimus TaxID=88925 RepID=UPI00315D8D84